MITMNGKEVTKEEALAIINNPNVIITHASMDMDASKESKEAPYTNEGFTIDKEYIASFSKQMENFNAGYMRTAFTNSKKINGKSLYLVFLEPKYLSRWQKALLWCIERLL